MDRAMNLSPRGEEVTHVASQHRVRSNCRHRAHRRLPAGVAQGRHRPVGGCRGARRRGALPGSGLPRHLLAGRLGFPRSSGGHRGGARRLPVRWPVHQGLLHGGSRVDRGLDRRHPGGPERLVRLDRLGRLAGMGDAPSDATRPGHAVAVRNVARVSLLDKPASQVA